MRPGLGEAPDTPGPQPRGGCLPVQVPLRPPSLWPWHFLHPGFLCRLQDFFFQDLFFAFTFLIHLECVWLHLSGVQFSFLPDGRSLVPTPVLSQPALFPPSRTPTFVVYYVLVCVGIYFWILCCFPLSVPLPEPR